MKLNVIKRSGAQEPLAVEKWQSQIANICKGIADVSQSMIEIKAQPHFYDGITTRTIDEITLRAIVDLIDVESNPDLGNTNYQYVAGKQRLSMLRKDVYGAYQPPHLYQIVKKNVDTGLYTKELLDWYSEDDWNRMEEFIDHEKDEQYSYAAIEQLIEKYLVRNRATKEIYETPQVRYMIAAATVFHKEEPNSARMRYIKEYYQAASDGLFTLATPVLAGLGTPTKQFSSCVLIRSDDDLDSIFASGEMMAKYASKRAGIGLEIGRLRPLGSPIRGGEVMHTGMIPFLKKWFGDLRSCSQGGIRNASATVFYPIWHYQFDDLIVLKNNQGTDETRVRHMDYGVVLSAFFWKRFKNRENITFFDPNEVPELYEAFYSNSEKFEELYVKYEKRKDLRKKTMNAEDVFKGGILKERTDTGRIYLVFIDNVMNQGPFDPEYHTIYQSNLCCVTGETQVTFLHENGKTEQMSVASAVERFELGNLTTSKIKSFKNGEVSWENVSAAVKTKTVTELYEIEDENGNILRCTEDHRIFTKNRGYVRADELVETDELMTETRLSKSRVNKIKVEPTDVYDLSVPETECFFADNILVHNCEILLPTVPFNSLDDEGEFKLNLDDGTEITLPGQHKVLLANGEKKKVRELTEEDDIQELMI
jgi:ribonucleotide reductase alpha subunit